MGEKLRNLSQLDLRGTKVSVELNSPQYEGDPPVVHIQTDAVRIECSFEEFFSLASAIMVAEQNFKIIKGLKY